MSMFHACTRKSVERDLEQVTIGAVITAVAALYALLGYRLMTMPAYAIDGEVTYNVNLNLDQARALGIVDVAG